MRCKYLLNDRQRMALNACNTEGCVKSNFPSLKSLVAEGCLVHILILSLLHQREREREYV